METNDKERTLSGHQGALYDAAWNSTTQEWVTAGGDGVVAKWSFDDPTAGQAVLHHEKAFFCICLNGDGLVAGTEDGELFFLDSKGSVIRWSAHRGGVFALLLHTNGRIYSGGGDGRVLEWTDGKLTGEWALSSPDKIRTLVAHGSSIFVSSSNGEGRLWNPADTAGLAGAPAMGFHEGGLYAAIFIAAKNVWITGGRDGHLRVWDETGESILSLPGHEGAIYRMQRTGDLIWTASRDKTVKCWSVDSLQPLAKWTHRNGGCRRSVNALICGGPNLEWMLAGGDDRQGHVVEWLKLLPTDGL
mgnify:FL=1